MDWGKYYFKYVSVEIIPIRLRYLQKKLTNFLCNSFKILLSFLALAFGTCHCHTSYPQTKPVPQQREQRQEPNPHPHPKQRVISLNLVLLSASCLFVDNKNLMDGQVKNGQNFTFDDYSNIRTWNRQNKN